MTRILSLDDEPEMLDLLSLILALWGYEHLKTTDSFEALSILRSEPIDLFTQDFMRPDVDGWELLHRIKSDENLRDIPVLGISAGARDARAEQLKRVDLDMERDLDGYLTKPFEPLELLDAIAEVLARRRSPLPPRHALCIDSPLAALADDDPRVRRVAIWVLAKVGDDRSVEALTAALADDDERVRRAAARALDTILHPRLVTRLRRRLDRAVRRLIRLLWGRRGPGNLL